MSVSGDDVLNNAIILDSADFRAALWNAVKTVPDFTKISEDAQPLPSPISISPVLHSSSTLLEISGKIH
jgi:hypothetical protein